MYILIKSLFLFFLFLISCHSEPSISSPFLGKKTIETPIQIDPLGKTIAERIPPPSKYIRVEASIPSFHAYLRSLPLKPTGSLVKYYNGENKNAPSVYGHVIDLPIGSKDLHQCADAVMRLRAEYLWKQKKYESIHFNFTNGFSVHYKEWMRGRRMVVKGNKTYWDNKNLPSNTYKDFWKYMELIFTYAGTASLAKELIKVNIDEAEIGDVLIQGGFPGHAVIIVDKAFDPKSKKELFLLAQSYMPAQEIQLLNNPSNSLTNPWFELNKGIIQTPEWTFSSDDLKRFAN